MVEVVRIPVLSDNYVWLMHDAASGQTVVVDPAVADPVLAAAADRGWTITDIWNTHWHPDHVGGNLAIKQQSGCRITGPVAEATRIPGIDRAVGGGEAVQIGAVTAHVLDVPAHTAGHIAYHLPEAAIVFVGDTLFAMGCGRLFEGTAQQMFAAMRLFDAMPPETAVYCAHEYTLSNGRFALTVEPENAALVARVAAVEAARAKGEPTVPTSIALEQATNPFLRAADVAQLALRRTAKDQA